MHLQRMKSCSTVQGMLLSLQECHFNFFIVLLTMQGVILNVLILCWKAPLLTIEQASCLYYSLNLACFDLSCNVTLTTTTYKVSNCGIYFTIFRQNCCVFHLYFCFFWVVFSFFVTYQVTVVLKHMPDVKIGTRYQFWRVGKVLQESKSVFAETIALKHEINSLAVTWSNGTVLL